MAIFAKVHHSVVDGYTLTRTMELAFTKEPESRQTRLFYNVPLETAALEDQSACRAKPTRILRSSGTDVRSLPALTGRSAG